MSANELRLWAQFYQEPQGLDRIEIMLARISAILVNMLGNPRTPRTTQEYMLDYEPTKPDELSTSDLMAWATAHNATIDKQ